MEKRRHVWAEKEEGNYNLKERTLRVLEGAFRSAESDFVSLLSMLRCTSENRRSRNVGNGVLHEQPFWIGFDF